ncbi:hypothetical protein [Streptomyces triticirhizae]|uniref:Lipoprotein n=1 Tax=Streptomyces triticirhizae TaxID=2483353 RepID=A0A3M2LWX5_9ACTN|nr:hypothetical protein [Streptomyces triticirhizae]RMI41931.1 hypothetical protein EBN88_10090 [Streptomyces triticirhizae]
MTRRLRTALLAATATALLLTATTACGDDSDDGGNDDIPGVDEGGASEEPETPTDAPTDEVPDRPEITLPENLELTFEGWESADPSEQSVLNDGRERLRSIFAAAAQDRDPAADHVLFYHGEGEGLSNAQYWIEGFTEFNLTIEGTIRYVEPEVTVDGDAATLNYCADESEASAVDIDTGEPTEASEEPDLYYTTNLQKDDRGVWVTTNVHTERQDCAR